MNALEVIAQLQGLYNSGAQYAQETVSKPNGDPIHDETTAGFLAQFRALNFDADPGLGYRVSQSLTDWSTWADQFSTACKALLQYRELWNYSSHVDPGSGLTLPGTDSGFHLGWSSISIGDSGASFDDPMTGWYDNTVQPLFAQLAVKGAVDWVVAPLKDATNALTGLGDWAIGAVVAIVVILVLVLAIKVT